jgi:predicted metal-binding protein
MVSRKRAKRECGTACESRDSRNEATAAPATVGGEHLPDATEVRPNDDSGRRQGATTRKPGNLPSFFSRAGRGASARGAMRVTTNSVGCRTTVLVCITCRASTDPTDSPRKGAALADATTHALGDADDVDVLRVRCLGNCNRGLSAAIRREDAWTYVFGGLDAERDGPTLIAGARLFAESTDGLMPWRGRPDPLKRGLIARMPPLSFAGEPADSEGCAPGTRADNTP